LMQLFHEQLEQLHSSVHEEIASTSPHNSQLWLTSAQLPALWPVQSLLNSAQSLWTSRSPCIITITSCFS
jgi:hypothetical protein